jgi:hypothetical protein
MRQLPLIFAVALAVGLSGCSSEPKVRTHNYAMGETAQLGHWIYTVFETQWMPQLGDPGSPRVPQHRFFLVRLNIVNGGSSEMMSPNLTLEDDKGNSYAELNSGDGVPQWIGYLRSVKPADSMQGNAVFDVPPAHYKLRVSDEDGTRVGLIDIPLSFNAETPEVPIPGQEKKR